MRFNVSKTFSEITPESAEEGDFSDTGFIWEDQEYTLAELKDLIKSEGFHTETGCNWFTTGFYIDDYKTGTEREENLHITLIKGKEVSR